jgi:taurine dioxygenase
MTLLLRKLSDNIGAEIFSFDASAALTPQVCQAIRRALFDHLVLVFRNQALTVSEQIQFTDSLGPLEAAWDTSNTHPEDPRLQVITNAGRQKGSRRTSSQHWHSDRSFVERPVLATILHAVTLPPVGGDTLYADMRSAYETLPHDIQCRIGDLSTSHSYRFQFLNLRSMRISPSVAMAEAERFPDTIHPLVRIHPFTGRKSLYLSELCLSEIVGIEKDQAQRLLSELYEHALQPKFIYRHTWKAGDLVIWDNPSLMHRVADIPHDHARILHRTTIAGTVPSQGLTQCS